MFGRSRSSAPLLAPSHVHAHMAAHAGHSVRILYITSHWLAAMAVNSPFFLADASKCSISACWPNCLCDASKCSKSDDWPYCLCLPGEIHLETCIKDLRERFARCELLVSPPLVAFRCGSGGRPDCAAAGSGLPAWPLGWTCGGRSGASGGLAEDLQRKYEPHHTTPDASVVRCRQLSMAL